MTTTTTTTGATPTAQEIAELRAEVAELEAQNAAAAAPSDAELTAAIAAANATFLDAGQPLVVADLVVSVAGDNRQHQGGRPPMTPAQMAAMIPADKRVEFLANLAGLVAGLHRGH